MPYKIYELRGYDEEVYLGETNTYIIFGKLLLIKNNYYRWCSLNGNKVRVRGVGSSIPEEKETRGNDDYLPCPYCGYEYKNPFKLHYDEDEYECPCYGSTLKYNRQITISWDVEVVDENKPQEIELK